MNINISLEKTKIFDPAETQAKNEETLNHKLKELPVEILNLKLLESAKNQNLDQEKNALAQSALNGEGFTSVKPEPHFEDEISSIPNGTPYTNSSMADIDFPELFRIFVIERLEKLNDVQIKKNRGFKKEPEEAIKQLKDYLSGQNNIDTTLLEYIIWGLVYYKRYHKEEASKHLDKAEKIIEVYRKQDLPINEVHFKLLMMVYSAKADLIFPTEDPEKMNMAEAHLKAHKRILTKFFPNDEEQILINIEIKARLHLHRKNYPEAIRCLKRVLNSKKQMNIDNNNAQALTYLHFIDTYLALGDESQALNSFLIGFKLIERDKSKNYIMGRLLCKMAKLYLNLSKDSKNEAEECYLRGLDILSVALLPGNSFIKEFVPDFEEKFRCKYLPKEKLDLPIPTELERLRKKFENKVLFSYYNLNNSTI